MTTGAGKYDDLCTYVRQQTHAQGCVVIVMDGDKGHGFSVQGTPATLFALPDVLHETADQMRDDVLRMFNHP